MTATVYSVVRAGWERLPPSLLPTQEVAAVRVRAVRKVCRITHHTTRAPLHWPHAILVALLMPPGD